MIRATYRMARYWLLSALFVLSAIFIYTRSPLYGADPTPTPNVSTVPRPDQIFTPTPAPKPVIVIITRTAVATVSTQRAAATPTPPTTNDPSPQSNAAPAAPMTTGEGVLSTTVGIVNAAANVTINEEPTLSLRIQITQTLIWQGDLRSLQFVISNPSARNLTQLELQYSLPPGLEAVTSTLDQAGSAIVNTATTQGPGLLIRWPQLAPAHSATATVTVRVRTDVPNGVFLDNQVQVRSSEGAIAAAPFTLVMPPVELPYFRTR